MDNPNAEPRVLHEWQPNGYLRLRCVRRNAMDSLEVDVGTGWSKADPREYAVSLFIEVVDLARMLEEP